MNLSSLESSPETSLSQKLGVAADTRHGTQDVEPPIIPQDVWQEARGRILDVNRAVSPQLQDELFLNQRLLFVRQQAHLFFRYHIPIWPPRLLLRKMVRKLLVPLLMPQADFNEAVGDVLVEMQRRNHSRVTAMQGTEELMDEMNQQIQELRGQVAALQTRLNSSSTASVRGVRDGAERP